MTMFERFTVEARADVALAMVEARVARAERVGTEHLLLALLSRPDCLSAEVLGRHGLDLTRARAVLAALDSGYTGELDPEALRAIGIDLDSVRASVEASFGQGALDRPDGGGSRARGLPGHTSFSPRAKKVLELGLREALRLKQRSIADGHLLLGILREGEGLAAQVLDVAGVDLAAVRADLDHGLREAG
jgi:ATP-dependent Clp protease ATP-binding subunit ClpA